MSPMRCLLKVVIAIVACISPGYCASPNKPNVVLILADDLGYETLGCYGGQSYETPHLDRLAAEGMRFERAYAMPLCTNTRIQLMTGRYNVNNWRAFGILDPAAKTFGHLMKSAGYKTCIAGKWQLTSYDPIDYPGADLRRDTGMRIEDAGFDEYSLWHTGHTEEKGSRYADPVIVQNGQRLAKTDGMYGPDIWTDFLTNFIRKNVDEPFFLYYSMALPHNPMNPTPDSPEWADPAMRDQDVTRFAADMIEYTDKMVGKLVSELDALGIREDTLILFLSDNGTNYRVRSKFRDRLVGGEKGKGTELGIRVPMIASWPGHIEDGQVSEALVDSVDILPTLLDVGRFDPTNPLPDLDGVSLLPVLDGTTSKARDQVFIHHDPRPGWDKDRFSLIRLAINGQYKLYEDGRLFDLHADFFEEHPIWPTADSAEQSSARAKLQNVLDEHANFDSFDPSTVPRPDPHSAMQRHAFQATHNGSIFVAEAEQLPFSRDESWQVENNAPDYVGTGYLRTIYATPATSETQTNSAENKASKQRGVCNIRLIAESAGEYRIAFRVRHDIQPIAEDSALLRFRFGSAGTWHDVGSVSQTKAGNWKWVTLEAPVAIVERSNVLQIAPAARNIKIDRLSVFRDEYRTQALDLRTPSSDFHPWASP